MIEQVVHRLGNFEITRRIGVGGMGEVWAGVHTTSGQPVAVKFVSRHGSQRDSYRETFHREVQAMASLDHPGIIRIFDYGDTEASPEATHPWQSGHSWLAMELAPGGSLEEASSVADWPQLKRILLAILDALAHAHARGIVHRDLKPANILVGQSPVRGNYLLLTDFGIAHLLDPAENLRTGDMQSLSAGTPLYMAPEQFQGLWRDCGPWTDLYALGCMAFEFACGAPPFVADSALGTAMMHLTTAVPPLTPRFEVPQGCAEWIAGLMEKDPTRRPRFAADAARSLARLPGDIRQATIPSSRNSEETMAATADFERTEILSSSHAFTTVMATLVLHETTDAIVEPIYRPATTTPPAGVDVPLPQIESAPVPVNWRRLGPDRSLATLPGTDQDLFGLRDIPFVDRNEHRDAIWQTLIEAQTSGTSRAILITGNAGLGKTHLMRWMAVRAHEVAAAITLSARHSPIAGPADGLPRLLLNHFGGLGLPRVKLYERIRSIVQKQAPELSSGQLNEEAASLVELLYPAYSDPTPDPRVPRVAIESPNHRYAIIARQLARWASQRPLLITIDDIHWGLDAFRFVEFLLTDPEASRIPAVLLVSGRMEAIDAQPQLQTIFQDVAQNATTRHLTLHPLAQDDHRQLINELMNLREDLGEMLVRSTSGNPLKAVQIVAHWVTHSLLVWTPTGYALTSPDAPNVLLEGNPIAIERIQAALGGPREVVVAWPCLEAAAAIGIEIEHIEWAPLCSHLGYFVRPGWIAKLAAHGIVEMSQGGWAFALPIYREALEQQARQNGRWIQVHRGLAATVTRIADNGTCLYERRGRHLIAAEMFEDALELLWIAIENRVQAASYPAALALTDLCFDACDKARLAPNDGRRVRLYWRQAETLRLMGYLQSSEKIIRDAQDRAAEYDYDLQGNIARVMAGIMGIAGKPEVALECYRRAVHHFKMTENWQGIGKSLHGLGFSHVNRGQFALARQCYHEGIEAARKADDELLENWCLSGIGDSLIRRGDEEAVPLFESAIASFERLGSRSGVAMANIGLGDCARVRQDYARADQHYARAIEVATRIKHLVLYWAPQLRALNAWERGHFEQAELLERGFRTLPLNTSNSPYYFGVQILNLALATTRGHWAQWDEGVLSINRCLTQSNVIRAPDVKVLLASRDIWASRKDVPRANQAENLARQLAYYLDIPVLIESDQG